MSQEQSTEPRDAETQPAIPQKPLSAEELKNALVERALAKPQVLGEQEYRQQLEETLLARFQHAATLLDEVRAYLEKLGAQQQAPQEATLGGDTGATSSPPEDLTLALDKLDAAHAAFQFAAMWHHWQIGPAVSVLSQASATNPAEPAAGAES